MMTNTNKASDPKMTNESQTVREIVVIGRDARSNAIYRFRDELGLSDHARARPTLEEVLEQFPQALYMTAQFDLVPLRDVRGVPRGGYR